MASHTGHTPLTETADNNNGEIFFNQPKSLKRALDRYVRQRNTFIATTVLLFVVCVVLLVCFIVLKPSGGESDGDDSPMDGFCNSPACISKAAGKSRVAFTRKVDL